MGGVDEVEIVTVRKSLVFSYLDRYASLMISIGSSMVIARLLTPEEIGVFSVTMILLSLVTTVRDLGAGGYLVQEKDLTVDRIRAVWTVQLSFGFALAILVLLASAPVAFFYHEPRMRNIMLIVAANYAINPFGSLTYAWQIREMRFAALGIVRFSAAFIGALVSIMLALKGMGPISLAFGALGATTTNALLAIYFRPKWFPWLPGVKEIRRVVEFGSKSTGSSIMQALAGGAPEILLGKLQTMTAVGLFSRANGLVAMFSRLVLDAISAVAISWFAKQSRDHGGISEPFLKATAYVTAIGWAFALGLVFLAHPVIHLLYGDQWDHAVGLTRLLAGVLVCGMPAALCIPALMALGAATKILYGTTFSAIFSMTCIAIGAYIGLLSMAIGIVIATLINTWFWLKITKLEIGIEWNDLKDPLRASAAVGITTSLGPCIAFAYFGPAPKEIFGPLAIGVPLAVASFVLAIIYFKHPLREELESINKRLRG